MGFVYFAILLFAPHLFLGFGKVFGVFVFCFLSFFFLCGSLCAPWIVNIYVWHYQSSISVYEFVACCCQWHSLSINICISIYVDWRTSTNFTRFLLIFLFWSQIGASCGLPTSKCLCLSLLFSDFCGQRFCGVLFCFFDKLLDFCQEQECYKWTEQQFLRCANYVEAKSKRLLSVDGWIASDWKNLWGENKGGNILFMWGNWVSKLNKLVWHT